jgi:YHS domain-containing protein
MNRRRVFRLAAIFVACAWLPGGGLGFAQDEQQPQPTTVKDPVCGMKIDPATAKGKIEHKGKTYYFCSDDCKAKFQKEPAKYAEKENPKR